MLSLLPSPFQASEGSKGTDRQGRFCAYSPSGLLSSSLVPIEAAESGWVFSLVISSGSSKHRSLFFDRREGDLRQTDRKRRRRRRRIGPLVSSLHLLKGRLPSSLSLAAAIEPRRAFSHRRRLLRRHSALIYLQSLILSLSVCSSSTCLFSIRCRGSRHRKRRGGEGKDGDGGRRPLHARGRAAVAKKIQHALCFVVPCKVNPLSGSKTSSKLSWTVREERRERRSLTRPQVVQRTNAVPPLLRNTPNSRTTMIQAALVAKGA